MFLKVHAECKCSNLNTTFHWYDILVTRRLRSWSLKIFDDHRCEKSWEILSQHVIYDLDPRSLHLDYFNHCRLKYNSSIDIHELHCQPSKVQIFWFNFSQRFHTLCFITRSSQVTKRYNFYWKICTNIMDFLTISSLIMIRNSHPTSSKSCSTSYKLIIFCYENIVCYLIFFWNYIEIYKHTFLV